jgi:hypothetical protein
MTSENSIGTNMTKKSESGVELNVENKKRRGPGCDRGMSNSKNMGLDYLHVLSLVTKISGR